MTIYGQNDTLETFRKIPKNMPNFSLSQRGLKMVNTLDSTYTKNKLDCSKKETTVCDSVADLKRVHSKLAIDTNKLRVLKQKNSPRDTSISILAKKIKTFFPKGTISVGYDYGFLPYTVNMPSPSSAIKTEGVIETDVFNIPIDVSYFYTTQKNLIGLTNYFRLSYNADRYKDKLNTKLNGNLDAYRNNLGQLNSQKQQLLQKMAYTDYLSSINPDKWPIDAEKNKPNTPNLDVDTTGIGTIIPKLDTAGITKSLKDSLNANKYKSTADSLKQQAILYRNKKDSVEKVYDDYKNTYALLNDSIQKVQSKIDRLEALTSRSSPYGERSSYFNKFQNFLSGVKKMDVGLCYPAYSTFLANNIPVRGINFEYQKNNRFFAFTYGTTVSTLLYNNRNIEGVLQNVRNSYNYFDVNNLSSGRKILSAKFGVGEQEGNHAFVGFLIGKGVNTYFPNNSESSSLNLIESNLVFEADFRKKLFKSSSLDLVIGKSSLQDADINMGTLQAAAKELFSNFRSYAMLVKFKTNIPATKSNLTFSIRRIDPFFTSFGIGFIRSDNMRYEVKLDQPLGKLFRYTAVFRYEEDNLLKILNYKNIFYSLSNTVSYKIKRGLTLRLGYTPLIRKLNGQNYHITSKNSIVTGILSFTPRSKNVQKQFNLLYNAYHVTTDSTPINFQNFTYYHQFSFKGGFKTGLNVSWFKNNLKDSTGNNIFMAVLDFGYQFKNGSMFSIAGKSAFRPNGQFYPGFILKSSIKLSSYFFWENQVEKFIVGDLFNGYDLDNLKRFPYCFTTKLILNF